jgi:phosphate transport system protein
VTSIAEQVIYIVTGDRPTEEREKEDKTSADANISLDLE